MTFAAEMLRLRKARGLMRSEVALAANCTPTYLYWLEKGKRIPPLTGKIKRLVRVVTDNNEEEYQRLLNLLAAEYAALHPQAQKGPAVAEKKKYRTLSHSEYYQLCQAMHGLREVLTTQKPSKVEACKLLSDKTGFPVSQHALEDAIRDTDISWDMGRAVGKHQGGRDHITRAIVNAVIQLYKEVRVPIPDSLIRIADVVTQRLHRFEALHGENNKQS